MSATRDQLKSMPQDELDKLAAQLDRIHSMLGIARIVGGMVVASVGGLITVAIWVNNTTTLLAATQTQVKALSVERQDTLKEWGAWRGRKDETDAKVLQILENQGKMIERQHDLIDRVLRK